MKGKMTAKGTMMNEGQGDSVVESLTDPVTHTLQLSQSSWTWLRRLQILMRVGVC